MDAIRQTALDWFTRLRAGDLSAAERRAFRHWREADPAHAATFDAVAAFWDSDAFSRAAAELAVPAGTVPSWRRPMMRALAAAAALMLLWLASASLDLPVRLLADHRAAMGSRQDVVLADGSLVVLNSAAAIAAAMDGPTRRVRLLNGEAYFEVIPDPRRPFVVEAGGMRVRVLGTRFSVRADDGAVLVRSGVVQVTRPDGGEVRLEAGQALAGDGPARPAGDDGLAWLDGALVFHDRPLAEVLDEVGRYHSGIIVLANAGLGHIRVSGHYRLDDPAAVVESLAEVVSGRLTRLTDAVLIVR